MTISAARAVLRDERTGSEAEVLPGFGFNCFRFCAYLAGQPTEVLWAKPDFVVDPGSPSGSGNPILFPFPSRIYGTTVEWEGKVYTLPAGDGQGNAIHGFVHSRAWRVISQSAHRIVGEFQASVDDPRLLDCWPCDFRITADYELAGTMLSLTYQITNPDERPLPCGLGIHPYFHLPLSAVGVADDCIVTLPVSQSWELIDLIPTGRRLPLPDAAQTQVGRLFRDIRVDNAFGGLQFQHRRATARLLDRQANRGVSIDFDDTFRECVVYTPPHRQAICIEPYTCLPDLFRLTRQGIDAGLRVLRPGESFTANACIRVERLEG